MFLERSQNLARSVATLAVGGGLLLAAPISSLADDAMRFAPWLGDLQASAPGLQGQAAIIGADQAIAAATQAVPGAAAEVRILYAVTIGQQVVSVDALTGVVVAIGQKSDGTVDSNAAQDIDSASETGAVAPPVAVSEEQNLLPQAVITVEEAVLTAQAAAPGTVRGVELVREEGLLLFEVTIDNQEVYVNAVTGAVFEIEPTRGGS